MEKTRKNLIKKEIKINIGQKIKKSKLKSKRKNQSKNNIKNTFKNRKKTVRNFIKKKIIGGSSNSMFSRVRDSVVSAATSARQTLVNTTTSVKDTVVNVASATSFSSAIHLLKNRVESYIPNQDSVISFLNRPESDIAVLPPLDIIKKRFIAIFHIFNDEKLHTTGGSENSIKYLRELFDAIKKFNNVILQISIPSSDELNFNKFYNGEKGNLEKIIEKLLSEFVTILVPDVLEFIKKFLFGLFKIFNISENIGISSIPSDTFYVVLKHFIPSLPPEEIEIISKLIISNKKLVTQLAYIFMKLYEKTPIKNTDKKYPEDSRCLPSSKEDQIPYKAQPPSLMIDCCGNNNVVESSDQSPSPPTYVDTCIPYFIFVLVEFIEEQTKIRTLNPEIQVMASALCELLIACWKLYIYLGGYNTNFEIIPCNELAFIEQQQFTDNAKNCKELSQVYEEELHKNCRIYNENKK